LPAGKFSFPGVIFLFRHNVSRATRQSCVFAVKNPLSAVTHSVSRPSRDCYWP